MGCCLCGWSAVSKKTTRSWRPESGRRIYQRFCASKDWLFLRQQRLFSVAPSLRWHVRKPHASYVLPLKLHVDFLLHVIVRYGSFLLSVMNYRWLSVLSVRQSARVICIDLLYLSLFSTMMFDHNIIVPKHFIRQYFSNHTLFYYYTTIETCIYIFLGLADRMLTIFFLSRISLCVKILCFIYLINSKLTQ